MASLPATRFRAAGVVLAVLVVVALLAGPRAAWLVGWAGGLSHAIAESFPTQAAATPAPLDPVEIADKLRPATIKIRASFAKTPIDEAGVGSGTGIVLSAEQGVILTNAHVIMGAADIKITTSQSERWRPARVIARAGCEDLALLKVDNTEGLVSATLGRSSELKAGEAVFAFGYPLGSALGTDLSMTRGIISKPDLSLGSYQRLIQTDAAINPGNSGGPLVNMRGEVVAVNTLGLSAEVATNINFSISIDHAKDVVEILNQGQNLQWLGMNLVPNEYEDYFGIKGGMVVVGVDSGSPASRVGVEPAWLLTHVEGKAIDSQAQYCDVLRSRGDGDFLKVRMLARTETGRVWLEGEIALGKPEANTEKLQIVAKDEPTAEAGRDTTEARPDTTKLSDNFSADSGKWLTASGDWGEAAIRDGTYQIALRSEKQVFLSPASVAAAPTMAIVADVQLQGQGLIGLAVRYSEQGGSRGYYACAIAPQPKRYACFVVSSSGATTLAEPTPSDAIKPDQVNQIALVAQGDEVRLLINEQEVATFTDSTLAAGVPALFVANSQAEVSAVFDNVAVVTSNE